jgi:DNA polymerase-3 subunit epsilon
MIRELAFVDVETTGLDALEHEIVEIAVLRVDPWTFEVASRFQALVRPTRLSSACPEALRICGYSADRWAHALSLREALQAAAPLLDGATLAGHNVSFDRAFLDIAWIEAKLTPPALDHHVLDTASLAWPLLASGAVDSLSLGTLARHFGIAHAEPHRALSDACCALELARRLVGPESRRTPPAGRPPTGARRVYVCHPFASDPVGHTATVWRIARRLIEGGVLPIAPHLYLPQLVDERTERARALALCLGLVEAADELWVFGDHLSEGMRLEVAHAHAVGVTVRQVGWETEEARWVH